MEHHRGLVRGGRTLEGRAWDEQHDAAAIEAPERCAQSHRPVERVEGLRGLLEPRHRREIEICAEREHELIRCERAARGARLAPRGVDRAHIFLDPRDARGQQPRALAHRLLRAPLPEHDPGLGGAHQEIPRAIHEQDAVRAGGARGERTCAREPAEPAAQDESRAHPPPGGRSSTRLNMLRYFPQGRSNETCT